MAFKFADDCDYPVFISKPVGDDFRPLKPKGKTLKERAVDVSTLDSYLSEPLKIHVPTAILSAPTNNGIDPGAEFKAWDEHIKALKSATQIRDFGMSNFQTNIESLGKYIQARLPETKERCNFAEEPIGQSVFEKMIGIKPTHKGIAHKLLKLGLYPE